MMKKLLKEKPKNQTVFTTTEISQILEINDEKKLYSALIYACNNNDIIRVTRGVYVLDNNYLRLELGNKLRKPSYISLYTVLQENGIVFQPYTSVFLVSNRSCELNIDSKKYIYRKIKNEILLNKMGLVNDGNIIKASPERALCDKIYLDKDEHFDNLRRINWKLMKELNVKVYGKDKNIKKFILKYKS